MNMVRCGSCGKSFKHTNGLKNNHHWQKGECAGCHYLGMRKPYHKLYGKSIRGVTHVELHHTPITLSNAELFAKLAKIITGKDVNPIHFISYNKCEVVAQ